MSSQKEKRRRCAVRTRAALVTAGIELFSARGYYGASVDEIVNLAEVNKRMLYHYFGSKEALYSEVIRSVFSKLHLVELDAVDYAESATEAINTIFELYFSFLKENQDFVRLLMWENLNDGRFLAEHDGLLAKAPLLKRLGAIIRRGQTVGEISESVDVRHLIVSLLGACSIYHANKYTLAQSLKLNLDRPAALKKGLLSMQGLIMGAVLSKKAS